MMLSTVCMSFVFSASRVGSLGVTIRQTSSISCQIHITDKVKRKQRTGTDAFITKLPQNDPCSENQGADLLGSYYEADLRHCLRICEMLVFS